jgi:hypothetical protein
VPLAPALLLAALAAAPPCRTGAVVALDALNGPLDDLVRLGELAGAVPLEPNLIRRGGFRLREVCAEGTPLPWQTRVEALDDSSWIRPVPVRLQSSWNLRYPSGGNDGLLWAGRGLSSALSGGLAFRYGALSGAVAPEVVWQQNHAFELVPNGQSGALAFRSAWYADGIDLPQRFGAGPFTTAGLGESYLRVDAFGAALGFSTETQWLGPGLANALLLTNNAAGFPHVFLGTSRPADVWIGEVEALVFWGQLERSRYVASAGTPLIVGFALDYTPRWIPGLSVGLGRTFVQPWEGRKFRDYVPFLQTFWKKDLGEWYGRDEADNPQDNQLASVWLRWAFPEAGLELYGEWGREDHALSKNQLLMDPSRTGAYLLGAQKLWILGERWVRLQAEVIDLQDLRPDYFYSWYTHSADLGYTHDGQVLGAAIGPGGDSQRLGLDVFHARGRLGGYLERIRRNEGAFWQLIAPLGDDPVHGHDTEVSAGLRGVHTLSEVDVSWDLAASWRYYRDFADDVPNVRAGVTVTYAPRG